MKRKLIIASVVVVGLLLITLVVVAFSVGAIVKTGVETVGPSATKVDVKLASAKVWFLTSQVELTGFVLGNPAGYKTSSAVSVGHVSVRCQPTSVFSDKLVVESVEVKDPVITLEGGLTDNNLKKIEKNLNDYIGGDSAAPKSSASSSSPAKPGKKLQVNELSITGAKLQFNSPFSAGKTLTLSVPDIHLKGLGAGAQGITGVEVGEQALQSELAAAVEAIAKNGEQLGKEALSGGKGAAKGAADKLKGLFH